MNISEIDNLEEELASKADINHTHSTSDVDGLVEALSGKAELSHTHSTAQVTGLTTALAGKAAVSHTHNGGDVRGVLSQATIPWSGVVELPDAFPPQTHTHPLSEIVDLSTVLEGKADDLHTHLTSDVVGLDTLLSAKANTDHEHSVDQVVGLQEVLDLKTEIGHTHEMDEVQGLEDSLAAKAPVSHSHSISEVVDLEAALDGKSDAAHSHTISDIESLESALAERALSEHEHSPEEIQGLTLILSEKADWDHSHAPESVAGLDTLLAGKASLSHTHSTTDIGGLSDALLSKAALSHTHTVSDIAGFATAVAALAPPTTDASLLTTGTLDDDRLPDNVILEGDPRLTDARSPLSHEHPAATTNASGFMSAADKFRLDNLVTNAPVNADWNAVDGLARILNKPVSFPPSPHSHDLVTPNEDGFMSAEDKRKLSEIQEGAEANVQSDWTETAANSDAFIRNKPILGTAATRNVGSGADDVAAGNHFHDPATVFTGSSNKIPLQYLPALPSGTQIFSSGGLAQLTTAQQAEIVDGVIVILTDGRRLIYSGSGSKTAESSYILLSDATPDWSTIENKPGEATTSTAGFMSASDKSKLNEIAPGAEVNVQANWAETNTASDAFIQNKPTFGSAAFLNASNQGAQANSSEVVLGSDPRFLTANASRNGLMTAADFTKLSGLVPHPTGDGNSHVPATGTTNNGRFLKAGATANSAAWSQIGLTDIAGGGAQVGQIPKWNGTSWSPSADAGGIQGTGISAIVRLTEAQYNALGNNVSSSTLYVVV